MALQLGDAAPNFTAETTEGMITFHEYLGDGWGILFSHPADFTPVCTTELGAVAKLRGEFARRNTKVLALIADPELTVANLYGMLHPNASTTMTVRSVFIIGPDKKVKLMLTYPAATGRDFKEILRVLTSLQMTAKHQVATPADWREGEEVIITMALSNEEAAVRFPGYTTIKPYIRKTAQPV